MICAAQEKGWEFLFLGANIDAAEEAARIGIRRDRAANYKATARGTAAAFEVMSCTAAAVRRDGCIQEDWQDALK